MDKLYYKNINIQYIYIIFFIIQWIDLFFIYIFFI